MNGQNRSGYYSGLHREPCGGAVKKTKLRKGVNCDARNLKAAAPRQSFSALITFTSLQIQLIRELFYIQRPLSSQVVIFWRLVGRIFRHILTVHAQKLLFLSFRPKF